MTVDEKTCNQNAATACVNNWFLHGFEADQKAKMEACVIKAGCGANFDKMSKAEQEALAKKYETSVQTIGSAYKRLWAKTKAEMKRGKEAHEKRVAAMKADFKKSAL